MSKSILDPCCDSKMFWFDKNNQNVLFGDQRNEEHILCDGRVLQIQPDIILDARKLPFEDCSFWHVVLDPPHLEKLGPNTWLFKKYGRLNYDWRKDLNQMFDEAFRVLKVNGTLIFKWNENQIKVSELITIFRVKPLYGQIRTGKSSETVWLSFMKFCEV